MKLFALLTGLVMLCGTATAGGWFSPKPVEKVKISVPKADPVYAPADTAAVVTTDEEILSDQPIVIVKEYTPIKLDAVFGSGPGFYADMGTYLWINDYLPIEIGGRATRKEGGSVDLRGLLRYTRPALSLDQGYLRFHYGASLFVDSVELAPVGLFVGVETHIMPSVSVSADLYPIRIGREIRFGEIMFGGRIYL